MRTGSPDDLIDRQPYVVELWDAAGRRVESVLALTASPTIGYAILSAAIRDYPERRISIRYKGEVVSTYSR
jgi:hypothetical protein